MGGSQESWAERSLSPWEWLQGLLFPSAKNYPWRLCHLTCTAFQHTLSHKKKPMLVLAPFTHHMIGDQLHHHSCQSWFHGCFFLLPIWNGVKGDEQYCSRRILQCLCFLQRSLFPSRRKRCYQPPCLKKGERQGPQHLVLQQTPIVMLILCLWKVHLLLLLNLKAGRPSISVILASHSLTSVSVVCVWLQSTCYPGVTDGLTVLTESYCCCDPKWPGRQGLILPEMY